MTMRRLITSALLAVTMAGCSVSTQQEVEMGTQYAQQINAQLPIVQDPEINRYINVLGNQIAQRADQREIQYRFYVVNAREINAFAVPGGFIYINRGLIEQTDNLSELAGVLGHEVAHIANGDMVTLTLVQGVVNTFVIFLSRVVGHVVDRAVFKTERGHGPGFYIVAFICQIVFGILASAIVMWFSRQREFRADAGGAKLAGRGKMIAALEKLRGGAHRDLPDQLAAFGITGNIGQGFKRLFMSHPPISERIDALKNA
jgi:heat shock protein HtpX